MKVKWSLFKIDMGMYARDFWFKMKYWLCDLFGAIGGMLLAILQMIVKVVVIALMTVRVIAWKLLCFVRGLTNIGFIAALVVLYLNIKEAMGGVNFFHTSRFTLMLVLLGVHLAVFAACELLNPER